ncbi:MAG: tetratricopeptide repeat protein [Bacteroidetes bacterium]|nr:tetratricopeptide repeat protein [Bacteroidota bacterium]
MNDKKGIAKQLGNIGNVYVEIQEYDKAVENFQKSI